MSANFNLISDSKTKRIALIAANKAISEQTGWPVGFWWAELTHPYWEFTEKGYLVDFFSPDGGDLEADAFSDPDDPSGYSAHDLISLGFKRSPIHSALLKNTRSIKNIDPKNYDAVFLSGGQSPMYTFVDNQARHQLVVDFYEQEKLVCIVCHATSILLTARAKDGKLLVEGKTWTGFANSEEEYADNFTGVKIQPFWIEERAKKIPGTNFITASMFTPFAIRDGRLITGQQQYSGATVAKLLIQALGE